jgi:hypothetical protein
MRKIIYILVVCFLSIVIGIAANLTVIISNGKMPVPSPKANDARHMVMTTATKYPYLADIHTLQLEDETLYYSIGDALMVLPFLVVLVALFLYRQNMLQ